MTAYHVYGDYGFESECELESFSSYNGAIHWAKGYVRGGDMGGYNRIDVLSFADDGEAIEHWHTDNDSQD